MIHQKKPCRWGCLATSFAMALDIDVEDFFRLAGHDGGEIIFPELPEPQRRRGFHFSEAVWVAIQLGFAATPLEILPAIAPSQPLPNRPPVQVSYTPFGVSFNHTVFASLITSSAGVLEGMTSKGNWHAVAFDVGTIHDPDGPTYPYTLQECEKRGFFHSRLWQVRRVTNECE